MNRFNFDNAPSSLSSRMTPDDFFLSFSAAFLSLLQGSWAMCAPMFIPEKSFDADGNMA